nr:protein kinase [Kofleriaceae bacterium]
MATEGSTTRPTKLGRYELITRIGQGGMAEVQLAIQRGPAGFEKLVVVKLVHESLASQKTFVDMLLDEARVAALVKHPNVVDIYDLGEAEGRYFIAMEYLEGEPLLSVLRAGREGKRLDVLSTTRLVADTAEGLEAAHELRSMAGDPLELVHHDVSLGNIVVLYNGQVKLVDFGVAKATQTATQERRVQGKFSYMAPEKLRGGNGDRRSDIWSLGVVLWEALTLRRLFRGGNDSDTLRQVLEAPLQTPSEVNADVPAELDPIVMRALERDPDGRYATAKMMSDDLEEVLTQARYGARNDLIARYMQDTFRDHIAARKKLLQEVSVKGTASTETLDLAFSDPLIASGSAPGQNDFSVRFRRNSLEMAIARREEPSNPVTPLPAQLAASSDSDALVATPAAFDELSHAGARPLMDTLSQDPLPKEPVAAKPPEPEPEPAASTPAIPRTATQPRIHRESSSPAITSPRLEVIRKTPRPSEPTVEGVTLDPPKSKTSLVLLVLLLVVVGGAAAVYYFVLREDAQKRATETSSADLAPAPAPSPPTEPAAEVAPAGSAAPATLEPPATSSADPLYREGLKQLAANQLPAAIATFGRARDADPTFAPTYRGLGLAYEKLGDKASEKAQLTKYLQLAPSALDASRIRDKLAGL